MIKSPMIKARTCRVVAALAAILAVTACSTGGRTAPLGSHAPAASGKPVAGGNLRVNVAADPTSMQPWQYSSGVDRHVLFTMYEPVIELSLKDFTLQPSIAKSWAFDKTGKVATLELQPGITFHDGSKLRAEDVIFSIEQAKNPQASRTAALLKAVVKIKKVSDSEIELHLSRRDRELFNTLSDVLVAKSDPKADYSGHPIGTGPFAFDAWNHGQSFTVKKNDHYWRKGLPYLDRVTFKVVSDQSTSLLQLQNNQADMVDQVSFAQIQQAKNAGITLNYPEQDLPAGLYELFLNTRKAPFSDERVRQALSYAIDRPRIATVLPGIFSVQSNPIPRDSANFNPKALSYDKPDVAKAKALLADAGHPDGVDGGTMYVYSDLGVDYTTAAQVIQDSAAKAGIKLTIRQLDVASWADQVLGKLDYTIGFGSAVAKPTDYDRVAHTWAKALGAATGWEKQNPGFYRLLATTRTTTTEQDFSKDIKQAQLEGMKGQPIIVVGGRKAPVGTNTRVGDFIASPQGFLFFRDVWLSS